ncbi:hypothetical protein F5Y03DRAFT_384448 [Xylaria venustula]|nr:hypothetical protein F5Y03DRAFT_384448 [Xylaria venustula]
MANTIRGDGLFQAHGALAALVENPGQLDHARRRFDDSPPSYRSRLSGTSTRSSSPDNRSDNERRREQRESKLRREYLASQPRFQFQDQTGDEAEQIISDHEDRISRVPPGTNFSQLAHDNVKKRWIEQGIWNEEWVNPRVKWTWKHEEPPTPKRQDDEAPSSLISANRTQKGKEVEKDPQAQAMLEREREASRPFHQFVYQVSKQRERIQQLLSHEGAAITAPPDINTAAYDVVKATWMKRGIWNTKWGMFPGMSWRHEQTLEDMLREEMGDDYRYEREHQERNRLDAGRAPLSPNGRSVSAGPVEIPNGNAGPAPLPSVRDPWPIPMDASFMGSPFEQQRSRSPRFGETRLREPSRQVAAAPDVAQNSRHASAGPVEVRNGNVDPAPSVPGSQHAPEVDVNVAPKQKRAPRRKRVNKEAQQARAPPRRSKRLQDAASDAPQPTRASKRQRAPALGRREDAARLH